MNEQHYDYIVIGGGVVGLATAFALKDHKVLVLEKEPHPALHQSGRNSGVIHSGIYYKPGSVKAETCRKGKKMLEDFCDENQIPIRQCGKVIVATDESEFWRLEMLRERGEQNGVNCQLIDEKTLKEIEPHACGKRAIHVPETGIVDFKLVCQKLSEQTKFARCQKVVSVSKSGSVRTEKDVFYADRVINCGGLYADKIARMCGVEPDLQIIPFRGVYYKIKHNRRALCRTMIYPVPDPQFPFLGVHFTSTIDGGVEVGPNAVLALGREAYSLLETNLRETAEIFAYPGALKLFAKHWRMGLKEMWMSVSKGRYVQELRKLVPDVKRSDLEPRVSGIRAQAVDRDGNLVDDFRLVRSGNVLHVLNAPSPAATAAFAIAEKIVHSFEE
jgi:L-2-hydroxyglutarate oxidase